LTTTQQGLGYRWQRRRLRILARDRRRCHWCGGIANTVDHLVPRCDGGSNHDENLVAACTSCNSRRGAQLAAERQAARRGQPPPAAGPRRVWPGAITLDD